MIVMLRFQLMLMVRLSLILMLIMKIRTSYSFIVVASDGVNEAVEQSVTLNVNNLDEVAPTITSGDSAGSIDENSGADTVIYTAAADDSLDDASAGVTFSLAAGHDSSLSINANGEVILASDANYEDQTSYSFTVVASDGVNADVLQLVTLNVNNVDEADPAITSDASDAVAVNENSGADQVVYTASATDTDANVEGITFSLVDESLGFSIDAESGVVTTNADFAANYEDAQSQSFTVVASDVAGNASVQVVTVAVNNLDEVAPTITSDASDAVAVNENSGADQVVYTANATDTDANVEGITFSLADDTLGFSIDAESGVVTTNADFAANYEDAQSQSFTVVATDVAGNASEQLVTVAVNNLDEVAPTIGSGDTGAAVDENSDAGQVVYTAAATDTDANVEGITFSLADDSLGFSIDADTGVVTTNADFAADFEAAQSQSFTVVATDIAGNSSEQVVTVAVNNLDEVAPTITSGDSAGSIDENSGAGSVIYTATADDSQDISAGVTFSLAAGHDSSLSINANGEVILASDADYETQSEYSFTVIASDGVNADVEQPVTLTVNNLDEVAPTIDSGASGNAVNENSGAEQVVYTATASDTDANVEGVTLSLADETLGFSIDENGVVTTNEDFAADYEDAQSQSFTVVATDAAGNASEQVVTVAVNNLDEVAPTLDPSSNLSNVSVLTSNFETGVVVYQALATDTDANVEDVTFSLSGVDASRFDIDSSGQVTAIESEAELKDEYRFSVNATDFAGNSSDDYEVILTVVDVDNAAPIFTSSASATIDENIGSSQIIYVATSQDESEVSYSLADADAGLAINQITGEVTLASDANYEDQTSYSFTVVASDEAGNLAELPVTVDVNNLDEIAPTIALDALVTAVDENSGAGQVVYTATATDTDFNGEEDITFSLADETLGFSIDENGVVTTNSDFDADFEDAQSQSFTVVATDVAGNASEQLVTVAVNNLDEVAPSIDSGDTGTAVEENSGAGQVVYTASASDTDFNDAEDITYSLATGHDPSLSINANGEVILASDADYETNQSYSFTLIATDAAGNASEQVVTVAVDNLDEVAPTITSSVSATIDENITAGQVVYTATADDSLDISAGVTLRLSDDSDAALSINANGEVILASDADYETQSEYSFTVIASDGVNEAVEQSVTLNVNNLDEVAPTIASGASADSTDENSGAGTVIYTATADDTSDISAGVTYSLGAGSDAGLDINPSTGEVSLISDADYEAKFSYSFAVVATDGAGNSSEPKLVTLNINDLDEAAPTITSNASNAILVNENSGAGQVVYTATATDSADTSDGFSFSLADETLGFSIDAESGVVTTNADFAANYEDAQSQSFTVVASDVANNASEQEVTVAVNNLDEVAPTITSDASDAVAVNENSGADQVVYTANATDTDANVEGITFSLVDESLGFSIDAESGVVTTNADFAADYEDAQSQSFTVVATDVAGNASQQVVNVKVVNVDDTAPAITSGDSPESTILPLVNENSGAGQVIYTAKAVDIDTTDSVVQYSLGVGSDSSLSINRWNGQVRLSSDPDHEIQEQYVFTVIATDAVGNSSEQEVTLTINDLDEVAPTIDSIEQATVLEVYSVEDSPTYASFNGVVYTASADDSADISAGINYQIANPNFGNDSSATLSINAGTGEVSLDTGTGELSYHNQPTYTFDITATDVAGNVSEAQTVTLTVLEAQPEAAVLRHQDQELIQDGTFTKDPTILVSNLKLGAKWEYSTDGGNTWDLGALNAASAEELIQIDEDGDYQVDVRVTNAQGESTSLASPISISVDNLPPTAQFVNADSDAQTISVNYSEALDSDHLPDPTDYVISQNGTSLTVSNVSLNPEDSSILVLSIIESFNSGALNFKYNASDNSNNHVTDLAGNALDQSFEQMIVSDGYIRGAQVYVDENGDGIADEDELRGEVTSDAFGQIILTQGFWEDERNYNSDTDEKYSIIIKGGVNMDSGAPNEIELSAPGGYAVINPLSTLVQEVVSSGVSLSQAESTITTSLGITGSGDLSKYDPQSDNNVANRVIATQIATVLAVASSTETTGSENAETLALAKLANTISSAEGTVTLDSSTMGEVLDGVVDDTEVLTALNLAVDAMENYKSLDPETAFEAIVKAQATAIDKVKPQAPEPTLAPESNSGVSDTDALSNVTNPIVRFSIDTTAVDGSAVIAGDKLEIFNNGISLGVFDIEAVHIEKGYYDYQWLDDLPDASHFVSAKLKDLAGNESYVSTYVFMIDTVPLEITSGNTAESIDENTVESQDIYTATVAATETDFWKFELSDDSDPALSINPETGVVTLTNPDIDSDTDSDSRYPDYEAQQQYIFTVIVYDNAGNTTEQTVTLDINNLDEIAPTITSGDTGTSVDENSDAGQVVYTATATDTDFNGAEDITFSLADDTLGFSIDENGVVTTNADFAANYEDATVAKLYGSCL
jgi:hypothetical protein